MKQYKKNSALAFAALAAFLITTGCHHKHAAAPNRPSLRRETAPAPTANITVTPQPSLPAKADAELDDDQRDGCLDRWNRRRFRQRHQDGNPTDTTTYHLVARGDGGSTDATATVTVARAQARTPQDR